MNILSKLNSPFMYLICGSIIVFEMIICVIFAVRAYRAGKMIGMDTAKMKTAIVASMSFAALPSIAILLGVIALSGSLGTPWPWVRLSVVGALHYETQVAEGAAEAVGIGGLSAANMTPEAFVTIAFLMSFCIIWGISFTIFTCKKYASKLGGGKLAEAKAAADDKPKLNKKGKPRINFSAFADHGMTAMFIGMVAAYFGSYVGKFVSGDGIFKFTGNWMPIAVSLVACAVMGVFIWIRDKKNAAWIDSFAIAGSMLIAMAAAVFLGKLA
ncbi:MAG: DUF5058 family protein [Firmicutes bacterium]|nr:DUF5058 family protein [Bacillota bacterium]